MLTKTILLTGALATFGALGLGQAAAGPLCGGPGNPCLMPLHPVNPTLIHPVGPVLHPVLPTGPMTGGPVFIPPHPAPAPSGPDFGISVHLGDGGYADGGDFVTCREAKSIVRHHGYRHVKTQACGDGDYTFFGTRHGNPYVMEVSDSGEILNVDIAD